MMKYVILVLVTGVCFNLSASPSFMELANQATESILSAIIKHPFVLEIANGTLPQQKFKYYSEQDRLYDWRYSNTMLDLARKSNLVAPREFLINAAHDSTLHWLGPIPDTMKQCPDCQAYSDFEAHCAQNSFSVGLAAIAPCYVVYFRVGSWLKSNSVPNNTYQNWIDENSSPHYREQVAEFEKHLNLVAANVTVEEQNRMLAAYRRSAQYEWHFWDSAYKEEAWGPN